MINSFHLFLLYLTNFLIVEFAIYLHNVKMYCLFIHLIKIIDILYKSLSSNFY